MRTEKEIKDKIANKEEYLENHYSSSITDEIMILKALLESTDEEKEKYYKYVLEKVEPYYTYVQRKEAEDKADEFFTKNIKGKKEGPKKEALLKQYEEMRPTTYTESLWAGYRVMKWYIEENDEFYI